MRRSSVSYADEALRLSAMAHHGGMSRAAVEAAAEIFEEEVREEEARGERAPLTKKRILTDRKQQRQLRSSSRIDLFRHELRGMTNLAGPVVATYMLELFPGITSIILVGHVRSADNKTAEYLDGTALSVAYINMVGMSVGLGLATAMDTLCSQAYGASETKKMGTYLQTGTIVLGFTYLIIVAPLFWFCTDILVALGQPDEVSELAGTFTKYLLPGVPFLYMYELFRKILQAQNIVAPMFYVAIGANFVNIGLGYYLVYHTSWSWLGAAVARTTCNMSFLFCLLPYLTFSGLTKSFWGGLHLRNAVAGISQFLHLGVPGMLQLVFEWCAFEVLALLCGLLPSSVTAIGANAVVLNISSLTYMFYLGISVAGNVRIGNALGARDHRRAGFAAMMTIAMGGLTALLCSIFLILFRSHLPLLFTHDEGIIDLATVLLGICALYQVPDAVSSAVMGVFRGAGRQTLGAWMNLAAYYGVGIPAGCALAFVAKLGVVGLWLGLTMGLTLIAVIGTCIVLYSDWEKLSKEAAERVNAVDYQQAISAGDG